MEVPAGARATTNRNHVCLSTATGNMNWISPKPDRLVDAGLRTCFAIGRWCPYCDKPLAMSLPTNTRIPTPGRSQLRNSTLDRRRQWHPTCHYRPILRNLKNQVTENIKSRTCEIDDIHRMKYDKFFIARSILL